MMHKVTDLKKVPHHFLPVEKEQDSRVHSSRQPDSSDCNDSS